MTSKLAVSVLFANLTPFLFLVVACVKRRDVAFWYSISLGIMFLVINAAWSFVIRGFLVESELFRSEMGDVLSAIYRDWYFVYFYILLLLGYVLAIVRRKKAFR